jgi:hypothetical protein
LEYRQLIQGKRFTHERDKQDPPRKPRWSAKMLRRPKIRRAFQKFAHGEKLDHAAALAREPAQGVL